MTQEKRDAVALTEAYLTTKDGVRLFFQTLGNAAQAIVIPNGTIFLDDFKHLAHDRTLLLYDPRNRGRSDSVNDASKRKRGILQDVEDLESVRQHFGIGRMNVIGHSYMGLMVILYAISYAVYVNRVVQIGPMGPVPDKPYPAHLTGADATLREVFAELAQLQKDRGSETPQEFCRKFWSVLRLLYVTNPADAGRVNWGRCDLPNEFNLMKYWTETILPSIQALKLSAEDLMQVKCPVLTIHGTRDRSAPYGGGREWAMLLPNARLVTVENAGHAPWIENPEEVFGSIQTFLEGSWPESAQKVRFLDPNQDSANSPTLSSDRKLPLRE